MPTPAHARLIFSGIFGDVAAPAEQWMFGLALTDLAPALQQADLVAMADAGAVAYQQVVGYLPAPVRLTRVRAVAIGDNGFTARQPFGQYLQADKAVSIAGGGGVTLTMPTQVAVAVSLQTDYPGPLGRGRFYLPGPPTGALQADGTLTNAQRDNIATRAQAFVQAINSGVATLNGSPRVAVASGGSITRGIAGAVRVVTQIKVGRRLDIQRRRAGDIKEDYGVLSIA